MAASCRAVYLSLANQLDNQPFHFDFCQAVQLLEQIFFKRSPVGFFREPSTETIRFAVNVSLLFPASQLQQIATDDKGAAKMVVNFLGLVGPVGVLPLHYTELLIARQQQFDLAFENFLNLFHHRTLSLYYRAWRKYRPLPKGDPENQGPGRALASFAGLATPALSNKQFVADQSLLRYAAFFTRRPRSCAVLEFILRDYLNVEVRVEQFAGTWYRLAPSDQWRFGIDTAEFHRAIGDEIWDVQSGVRIRLGPLTRKQYQNFLPDHPGFSTVRSLSRFFANTLSFELQLVLRRDEVPQYKVAEDKDASTPSLGWDTWIGSRPMDRDPDDTIVLLSEQ